MPTAAQTQQAHRHQRPRMVNLRICPDSAETPPDTLWQSLSPPLLSRPLQSHAREYLVNAGDELCRGAVSSFNPDTDKNVLIATWVRTDPNFPATSVDMYDVRTGEPLALLAVGWTDKPSTRRGVRIPCDLFTTLTPVIPGEQRSSQTYVRSILGDVVVDRRTRRYQPPETQFDLIHERAWLHTAMALATQLSLFLAGRIPDWILRQGTVIPKLSALVIDHRHERNDDRPIGTLYASDNIPENATDVQPVWDVGHWPKSHEVDPLNHRIFGVRQASPWSVYQSSVMKVDWELPDAGLKVSYAL